MIISLALLCVAVLTVGYVISTQNNFVAMSNKVKEASSNVDIFLKKRYDLLPNLIETVKGYANYESKTLEDVIKARSSAISMKDKSIENEKIHSEVSKIFALAESYPELKANESFVQLQKQLSDIETDIEKGRRYYNGVVSKYNTMIQQFPGLLIANMFGYKEIEYFEASESEKENIKVSFD